MGSYLSSITSAPKRGFNQYIKPHFSDFSKDTATFKIMLSLAVVYLIQWIVNLIVYSVSTT